MKFEQHIEACDQGELSFTNVEVRSDAFFLTTGSADGRISMVTPLLASVLFPFDVETDGEGEVRYQFDVGGTLYYHDGTEWQPSDGSVAQSGEENVTMMELDTLPVSGVAAVNPVLVVVDGGNAAEPIRVKGFSLSYERVFPRDSLLQRTIVRGRIVDILGQPVEGATVHVSFLSSLKGRYMEADGRMVSGNRSVTTDECGEWQLSLIPSNAFETDPDVQYRFVFEMAEGKIQKTSTSSRGIDVSVPAVAEVDFSTLVTS